MNVQAQFTAEVYMSHSLTEDAHAVLFPAFDGVTLSDAVRRYLDRGGVSILVGESRAEYIARQMSAERRASETPETFRRVVRDAETHSDLLLTAIDQELGGICRLHDLAPAFPPREKIATTSAAEIEARAAAVARVAVGLGVNLFLAPVLDALDGPNAWLDGRTWSHDPEVIGRLSAAFIRGVQGAGVAATAKHFPGFRSVTADPAIDATAQCTTSAQAIEAGLMPFRAAVAAEVDVIMIGPAIVRAMDPAKAALRSAQVVQRLTQDLSFQGVVMADDLDSQATMRGDSVAEVAIDALNAGCDFLLLADTGSQVADIAAIIEAAARSGRISAEALARSAAKVRALAAKRAVRLS
jgi:beta-N-acetylhexosaminidase